MIRILTTSLLFASCLLISLEGKEWVNWLGNASCSPTNYYEPYYLEELQTNIVSAVSQGMTLRTVGNGYSRNSLACSSRGLINLKQLNRVLTVDVDRCRVRVEAGITLEQLNEQLAAYGLALPNQPAIAKITLGGALSTAVHGTGHTGTLASFVYSIELVTADGQCHYLSAEDADIFAAAKVAYGSLGVIYAVTLQCEPLFYVSYNQFEGTMSDIERYQERDFFQYHLNIETGVVNMQVWQRCDPSDAENAPIACYVALPWYKGYEVRDLTAEFSVPCELLASALEKIETLIRKYRTTRLNVSTDIGVRFVEQDTGTLLSLSAGYPVASISVFSPPGDEYLPFYKDVEEALLSLQGRPHIGKINFLDYAKMMLLYGEQFQRFLDVKATLDPHNVFSNSFTDHLFFKNG